MFAALFAADSGRLFIAGTAQCLDNVFFACLCPAQNQWNDLDKEGQRVSETVAFLGLLLPYTDAVLGFGIWEAEEAAGFLVVGILDIS